MKYVNARTKTLLSLIVFLSLFGFCSGAPWNKFWAVLVAVFVVLLLVDMIFLESSNFQLDPFYSNWEARMKETKYD